ncbi:MAG: hypothetical protein JXR37_37610 [Kiritimatiellae bacterium]|nr:hypothetical protein [Kiritimatiellia bacterium]
MRSYARSVGSVRPVRSVRLAALVLAALAAGVPFTRSAAASPPLINDPANAELNAKREYPYLAPAHCDKFYGKLPRLYLHGLWKLMVLPDNETNELSTTDYRFTDGGVQRGFCGADFDDSDWPDFYIPQKIVLETNNVFGIAMEPMSEGSRTDFIQDGYSYLAVRFVVPADQRGKRVILRLGAANNLPILYVNGAEVARPRNHQVSGHADRHGLDITRWLDVRGVNRLVVRTYNVFHLARYGTRNISWNCNGVWQPVWLEFWPAARVDSVRIYPDYPEKIRVELNVDNGGQAGEKEIELAVEPWEGRCSLAVDDSGRRWRQAAGRHRLGKGITRLEAAMALSGIKPWHMDAPYVYSLKVWIDGQLAGWDTFGMRAVRREGRKILVNGKSAYFFGVGWSDGADFHVIQAAHGGQVAISLNKNDFLAQLLTFYRRNLNANALVRAEFQPETVYQFCDELGLARWDEPLLYAGGHPPPGFYRVRNPFWAGFRFGGRTPERIQSCDDWWRPYYRRIVDLNFNHPSILAWGTPTEMHHDNGRESMSRLVEIIRACGDSTRLICLDGTHFAHQAPAKGGRTVWSWWGENEGLPGMDFVQTHNLPMQYAGGRAFGYEIDELQVYEKRSRTAYAAQGGVPMTASPALLLDTGNAAPRARLKHETGYDLPALLEYTGRKYPWYGMYVFYMALFGVHDNAANTPLRQQYVGFEQQRLGETFRIHNAFFRGWGAAMRSHHEPDNELRRGDVLDPALIQPGILAAYMKRLQQRILPVLDWHLKHNLFAGEKAGYTLYVFNDAMSDFGGGRVEWRLVPGSAFEHFGKTQTAPAVCRSEVAVPPIPVGERFETHVEVAVPAQVEPGRYTVELVLNGAGGELARNTYPFFVGNRDRAPIPCRRRVALYETAAEPTTAAAVLRDAGVPFRALADFADLARFDVLIVAPRSVDPALTAGGDRIHEWVRAGGRILCLEQKQAAPVPFLNQMRFVKCAGLHVAEPIVPEHPVFSGLATMKDWDCLNDQRGVLYRGAVEPVSDGVLMLGGVSSGARSDHLMPRGTFHFGMVIAELRVGKGLSLFSQVEAVARYATDPVARKYLRQLLGYALSDGAGKSARPAPGAHEAGRAPRMSTLDARDAVYVDLTAHCNRGFADEGPDAAVRGWDGGGPENDMRTLPVGLQTLEGVPFRIVDPRQNAGRSCIVLGGGMLPLPEEAAGISVKKKARALHFLHTHGHGGETSAFAKYVVHYADGSTAEIPLISRKNIDGWWGNAPIEDGVVAWTGSNPQAGPICLYRHRWPNPHPEKMLDSVDFVSLRTGKTVPILVAITAEK